MIFTAESSSYQISLNFYIYNVPKGLLREESEHHALSISKLFLKATLRQRCHVMAILTLCHAMFPGSDR